MRAHDFLLELQLPKNKWVSITTSEAKAEIGGELVNLVKNAYSDTVHGSFVTSVSDVMPSDWLVLSWDKEPEVDAAIFYRKARSGETWHGCKIQGIGHDGTTKSKRYALNQIHRLLNKQGWWLESSHAMSRILKGSDMPSVTDVDLLQQLFNDPQLKMISRDTYTRILQSGLSISETVFGHPLLT